MKTADAVNLKFLFQCDACRAMTSTQQYHMIIRDEPAYGDAIHHFHAQVWDWLKTKAGQTRVTVELKKRKVAKSLRIGIIDASICTQKVQAVLLESSMVT